MSSFALNYVMNLLSRREYSEFELRCKMQEKPFPRKKLTKPLPIASKKIGKVINVLLKVI